MYLDTERNQGGAYASGLPVNVAHRARALLFVSNTPPYRSRRAAYHPQYPPLGRAADYYGVIVHI